MIDTISIPASSVLLLEWWKPLARFEGAYEISNVGNIRSLPRITPDGRHIKGRILRPRPNDKGYLRAHLSKDGIAKDYYVHSLVLEHFVGPLPTGQEGNHKLGNKADNKVSQLEYLTHADNVKHANEMGLSVCGSDHFNAVLEESDIVRIRKLKGRMMQREIAALFGISPGHVRRIQKRKAWAHVV